MSVKAQAPLPLKTFTVEQIDSHLTNIVKVMENSVHARREKCWKRIDYWLDERNRLTITNETS